MPKFTHNFWYFITFRAEANEATAANAGAANAASNNVVLIVIVVMIVMRMRMRVMMMMMMIIMVMVVAAVMLVVNGRRAFAKCSILFGVATTIQFLCPPQRTRLAHLQATAALPLYNWSFAQRECIQIGCHQLGLQRLGGRHGCAVIFARRRWC